MAVSECVFMFPGSQIAFPVPPTIQDERSGHKMTIEYLLFLVHNKLEVGGVFYL